MATKKSKSRLAEIYKAEKARGGGVASSLGKRALEKFDPRQFFNQDSFLAAVLPSLFKAYKVDTKATPETLAPSLSPAPTIGNVEVVNELSVIKTDTKINAKNSMVLPAMARDMNLMRQNIAKLVKAQGEKPAYKADMFFKRASEREANYESQFKKTKTSPTPVPKIAEQSTGGILSDVVGFFKNMLGYILKGAGLAALVAGIGKILEDPDTRESVKNFLVGAFKTVFDGLKNIFKVSGEALSDPEVIKSIVGAITELFTQLKNVVTNILSSEIDTPLGKFSIGAVIGAVVAAFVGFKLALVALEAAVFAAAGRIAGGAGLPSPGQSRPIPGTPPGTPGPGAPGTNPPKTTTPGLPGEKPGFQKTAEDKIKERAERMAAEKGGQRGVGSILSRFLTRIGSLTGGPIGAAWLTAYTAYEIIDALAPDAQQQVIDSVEALASIQYDIENIPEGPAKERSVKKLKERASLYEEKLKRLGIDYDQSFKRAEEARFRNLTPAPVDTGAGGGRGFVNPPMVSPTPVPSETPATSMAQATVPTLEQIGQAESGRMGYEAANRGKAGDMPNGMPGLSTKTVAEVMKLQQEKQLFAAGKYQIIPTTLAGLVNKGVVSPDDTFNKETQDKLGKSLYDTRIARAGNDPIQQQLELSKEWAAIANPITGVSYYAGVGNNKASIGVPTMTAAVMPSIGNNKASIGVPTMTAAVMPSIGTTLAAATTETSVAKMQLATAAPIIVNAPTTNVQQGGGGIQRVAQYTSPSAIDTEFAKLVSRVI